MCVDNAQLPYLEAYNALFVLECIASNRVLISMCPINIIVCVLCELELTV